MAVSFVKKNLYPGADLWYDKKKQARRCGMDICRGSERHIPGMIGLLKQVGQVHHLGRPDLFRAGAQKYDRAALEALLKDEKRPIFIAQEADRVLGYCFCILQEVAGDPVLADRRSLYIDDLCVDEACRGQHVGKALYRYVVQYAKEIGCQSVTLNVWAFNESAMRFYEAMGMQPQKVGMEMLLEEN
jgi:ribosomal protein S18 acetylase RimI-like enzyme